MKIWLFFHGRVEAGYPEAAEIMRILDEAKDMKGIHIEVMNPDEIDLVVDSAGAWSAHYQGKALDVPDVIVPRTGTETSYTGYSVMRFYERLGVPFVNDPSVVETVADKLHTLQVLAAAGLSVPRTVLGKFPPDLDMIENTIGFPLVVKTLKGTRGGGVFLSETRDKFKDLADLLVEANSGAHIIFQRYVSRSHGRDLRVFVVDGEVMAVMERNSGNTSFKSNISRGGLGNAYEPTPEIKALALGVTKHLGLDIAGVDLLFDETGFTVCEANSSPGFTGLEPSCHVNAAKAILNLAIKRGRRSMIDRLRGWWRRFEKVRLQATSSVSVAPIANRIEIAPQYAQAPQEQKIAA